MKKYEIFNEKTDEKYTKDFKDIEEAMTWITNHLDLSLNWKCKEVDSYSSNNNTILSLMNNSILPTELLEITKPLNHGADFSYAITDAPIFLFMVLDNISDEEIEVLQSGMLELGSVVIEKIPFLTLNYGRGFHFDFTVLGMKELDDSSFNAINIIAVDRANYKVKNIRTIGANPEIIKILQNGIKNNSYSEEFQKSITQSIYNRFSTYDIHKSGEIQKFTLSQQ